MGMLNGMGSLCLNVEMIRLLAHTRIETAARPMSKCFDLINTNIYIEMNLI
jgi:hypothetical protein